MALKWNRHKICKLCSKRSELQDSHILPSFFFKPLECPIETGSNGQSQPHSIVVRIGNIENPASLVQKNQLNTEFGFKEKLLCASCENKFSKLESYARELLYGRKRELMRERLDLPQISSCSQSAILGYRTIIAEYVKFKLFLLSILWRMAVSRLSTFEEVYLHKEERTLRKMLLTNNPGGRLDFPSTLLDLRFTDNDDESAITGFIRPPSRMTYERNTMLSMVMGGFQWMFHTGRIEVNHQLSTTFLDPSGSMLIHVCDAAVIMNGLTDIFVREGMPPLRSFEEMVAERI